MYNKFLFTNTFFFNFLITFIFLSLGQGAFGKNDPDKTSAKNERPYIDQPKNCFSLGKFPCSLLVQNSVLEIENGGQIYKLDRHSVIEFMNPSEVQILKGLILIRAKNEMSLKVSALFGLSFKGILMVNVDEVDQAKIFNLNASIRFVGEEFFQNEELPSGYENWFSRLNTQKKVSRGIISPIQRENFVNLWGKVSGLSLAGNKKALKEFDENWRNVIEESSQFYQEVVQRSLASIEEKDEQKNQIKRKKAQERDWLKKMYRQKNGLENSEY